MGLFKKRVKPNFNTVPAKGGPVVDVFSLNGEGYNTINASNTLLMRSGIEYWHMNVHAYGCDSNVTVARENASRFFSKLWDKGYYKEQPLVGWYRGLYAVFHGYTWGEVARESMEAFCKGFFKNKDMHMQELWYTSMMYISLCGGSIDDVVGWLQAVMAESLSQKKREKDAAMVMPVLKHYKVLQGIVAQVSFTTPQVGETLADYWDYLADKYMCEEAGLEAAMVRIFLAHTPYKPGYGIKTDGEFDLDCEKRKRSMGIKDEATYFNEQAKKGNLLPLSIVYYSNWIYETQSNKRSYPDFEKMVDDSIGRINKNRADIISQVMAQATKRSNCIVAVGNAFKQAEEHYATGLANHAMRKDSIEEMKKAVAFANTVNGAGLPQGRLNAVIRRAVWLYHMKKERHPMLTDKDIRDMYEIERLAIRRHNKKDEIKTRRLGTLLKDGFMEMHPQPQLWEPLRYKAFDYAGAFGITKYVLDEEPGVAEWLFQGVIENKKGKYNEKHITGAWLGLAWLHYSKEEYDQLDEAMTYIRRDTAAAEKKGADYMALLTEDAEKGSVDAMELLATFYCKDKDINKDDHIIKDMGRLLARRLSDMYMELSEKIEELPKKWAFITKRVLVEIDLAGYSPRLLDYIIMGLQNYLSPFYELLKNKEVYDAVYYKVSYRQMRDFLIMAQYEGHDFTRELQHVDEMIEKERRAEREAEFQRILHTKRERTVDDIVAESTARHRDDGISLVDVLMDAAERKINEDGLTNEELYNTGHRSELDREEDQMLRDFLKNPFK